MNTSSFSNTRYTRYNGIYAPDWIEITQQKKKTNRGEKIYVKKIKEKKNNRNTLSKQELTARSNSIDYKMWLE